MARVLLIGAFQTKHAKLGYLADAPARNGLYVENVDVSLSSGGIVWSGAEKLARMAEKAEVAAYPKLLITTMAFDPRAALADTAITLIPTLCDIEGLNPSLRQVFETVAAAAGIYRAQIAPRTDMLSVGVITPGATDRAGSEVTRLPVETGGKSTVFHANCYGGAAFALCGRRTPEGGD